MSVLVRMSPFDTNERAKKVLSIREATEFLNDFGSLERDRKMSLLGRNTKQRTPVKAEDGGWCDAHLLSQRQADH